MNYKIAFIVGGRLLAYRQPDTKIQLDRKKVRIITISQEKKGGTLPALQNSIPKIKGPLGGGGGS